MFGPTELTPHLISRLTSSAASSTGNAANAIDAAGLTGLHCWLAETFNAHPRLYALGCVVALLAVGAGVGLLTDLVLHRLCRGEGPADE